MNPMTPDLNNQTLPVPLDHPAPRNVPLPPDIYRAPAPMTEVEAVAASVPLSHYLWILRRHWWRILLFVGCAVTSSLVVSMRMFPIFESTATIDIDRQMPSAIIVQEATRTIANDSDQFLATQVKLVQS